jgi:pantetheine-phosphate adenylyltransferase
MKTVLYPGSFDPFTNGHYDLVCRAAQLFDKVIVAVAADNNKHTLFTLDERKALAEASVKEFGNVEVEAFTGLLVNYAKTKGASALVRGLRMVSDFEYEMQMATFNKDLCHELETVFFIADAELSYISSSQVRGIASLGGNVERYVTAEVAEALKQKYQK